MIYSTYSTHWFRGKWNHRTRDQGAISNKGQLCSTWHLWVSVWWQMLCSSIQCWRPMRWIQQQCVLMGHGCRYADDNNHRSLVQMTYSKQFARDLDRLPAFGKNFSCEAACTVFQWEPSAIVITIWWLCFKEGIRGLQFAYCHINASRAKLDNDNVCETS